MSIRAVIVGIFFMFTVDFCFAEADPRDPLVCGEIHAELNSKLKEINLSNVRFLSTATEVKGKICVTVLYKPLYESRRKMTDAEYEEITDTFDGVL